MACRCSAARTRVLRNLARTETTLRSSALAFGVYISSAAYWKPFAEDVSGLEARLWVRRRCAEAKLEPKIAPSVLFQARPKPCSKASTPSSHCPKATVGAGSWAACHGSGESLEALETLCIVGLPSLTGLYRASSWPLSPFNRRGRLKSAAGSLLSKWKARRRSGT